MPIKVKSLHSPELQVWPSTLAHPCETRVCLDFCFLPTFPLFLPACLTDADKRVAQDPEKPSEGVPTSLRFSSQPSSFSPATYGNDSSVPSAGIKDRSFQEKRELFESSLGSQKQDSSPVKISPVSERIRALEALAAKQNDSDWSDAGFTHFRDRHYEKSHSEIHGITLRSSVKKKPTSSEQDSPESPFEILGDTRRGSYFEDTADWMRAHLPPAPNFNIGESDFDDIKESSVMPECPSDETKSKDPYVPEIPSSFVGVPDEFMDSPDELSKQTLDGSNQSKPDTTEDESEFDLRFLPTAYMWDKQDKPDMDTQDPPFLSETQNTEIPTSAAPPDGFEAPSLVSPTPVPQDVSSAKQQSASLGLGSEGVEILEADSSGESDDTVIEDATGISNDAPTEGGFSADKQTLPNIQQKQYIQVPIINVIETDEQVLSDYEVEPDEEEDEQRYPIMQEPATEAPQPSEELSDVSRSEYEVAASKTDDVFFQEKIADSDGEYSPNHKVIQDDISNDAIDQASLPSKNSSSEEPHTQSAVPQNTDEASRESSFHNVKSDTTEIVPDLPPNYEDLSNDFESSDIDTYLDHYTSEELALKDQLNSGVCSVNNGETNELLKSNSQQAQNNTTLAQQPYEETVDDFDETVDESKQNYDIEPEPFPSNITANVPMEPVLSQNIMPDIDLEDQNIDIEDKKTIADSGNFSLIGEEDYMTRHEVEFPSFQENTLAQFPSFHDDPSGKISDVMSDFVTNDATEGPVITSTEQDEIIQYDDPHTGISPEPTSKPEPVEEESKQSEIVQSDTDAQISEKLAKIPEPTDTVSEQEDEIIQCNALDTQISPEIPTKPESTEVESSPTAEKDSFVEFMRECLKSQQDEEPQSLGLVQTTKEPTPAVSSPPAMIMDLEQECLTIYALKELGGSHKEQDDLSIPKDIPVAAKDTLSQNVFPSESLICSNPSLPNENLPDASLTKEIEALDIWVAEAYHLAEHVLALILTHLTGKVFPLGCQPSNPALNSLEPTTLSYSVACF